jgi:predicted nucleotide-binding protein
MVFWHIRVLLRDKKSGTTSYSYEMDLSENDVKIFAHQYQKGENVFLSGRWTDSSDIREVNIYQTEENSNVYETTQVTSSIAIFGQKKGMDITRQYIFKSPQREEERAVEKSPNISKNVFIVHGRDNKLALELADILKSLQLQPIILSEEPSGGRTLIEKLEKYSNVGYIFVIMAPDDVGKLADSESDLHYRVRQNVILEFGYFIGLLGRERVHCLYKGDIELPSDMFGVAYTQFNTSVKEAYWYIIKELKAVGYSLDL